MLIIKRDLDFENNQGEMLKDPKVQSYWKATALTGNSMVAKKFRKYCLQNMNSEIYEYECEKV